MNEAPIDCVGSLLERTSVAMLVPVADGGGEHTMTIDEAGATLGSDTIGRPEAIENHDGVSDMRLTLNNESPAFEIEMVRLDELELEDTDENSSIEPAVGVLERLGSAWHERVYDTDGKVASLVVSSRVSV